MNTIGYFSLLISAFLLALQIWQIYVHLGFRPKHCSQCKGFLQKSKYYKTKRIALRRRDPTYARDYLEYVYTYRVNDKEYYIESNTTGKDGSLPISVDIVYQTKNPKYAYIKTKSMTSHHQMLFIIILVPFILLFFILGILILTQY